MTPPMTPASRLVREDYSAFAMPYGPRCHRSSSFHRYRRRELMTEHKIAPEWRRECDACEGEGVTMRPDMPLHHSHSEAPEYATAPCGECDGEGWRWTDEPVTLAECRPGPFLHDGALGFKTEYGATIADGPVECPGHLVRFKVSNWPDAYCMDSGEFFWGGAKTHEERAKLLVHPVERLLVGEPE